MGKQKSCKKARLKWPKKWEVMGLLKAHLSGIFYDKEYYKCHY
jgi:hypothetical protein